MVYILKRDGRKERFNRRKIEQAMEKAFIEVDGEIDDYASSKIQTITNYIENKCQNEELSVEQIQDLVVAGLMNTKKQKVAEAYIIYRNDRSRARGNLIDKNIQEILMGTSEYWAKENSNKNARVVTTQRDYMAGEVSTDLTMRKLLPKVVVAAHKAGIIHFHDSDYFGQYALTNCELVNGEDMLQNGTVINGVMIEKPHRFITASTILTQIILAVTSSTYGGCTVSLTHLAPFVKLSYERYLKKYQAIEGISDKVAHELAIADTRKEVADGVQTFNYQVNSMTNTNGQAPFLSVFMYLSETDEYKDELAMIIEEFLRQRILGFKNEKGVYITPAFPKLLYVTEEDNITPDSKYWYLTELAAECTAKRLVPDYISEKMMKKLKVDANGNGHCFPCMGCRSFLLPYINEEGKPQYYGRFNMGVVTINLPDIALSSGGDFDKFWELFEERTEICHIALRKRYERIASITSDAAPILWQHGAFARLKPGESVEKLLRNDYSTLSLGYAGLYECVKYMTGESHSGGKGMEFGMKVMQALNDKTNQWRKAESIGYSLYGSPIESTTYKFAKCLKKRFGVIKDITDHGYITNSYHINVREQINAFDKLKIESKYQALSSGGAISYVEVPDLKDNTEAVIKLIQFMYDNIMYAEINSKSDYCQNCGYDGQIQIEENDKTGELYWKCPNCGNTDEKSMNVARRTCGYIGSQFWNQGRTEEIRDRVLHL